MADQDGPGGGELTRLVQESQGPSQAATGLGCRVGSCPPQESSDLWELAHTGLVVREGLVKAIRQEASILSAEQQSARGARKGNGLDLLLQLQGNLEEKLEETLSPGLGVFKRSWVGGGLLVEGFPCPIHEREAHPTGAEINPEGQCGQDRPWLV
jgi:hypothetical protein